MRPGFLRDLFIHLKLLVFARESGPVHIQKFRTEQANAFRTVLQSQLQILDGADIPGEPHAYAVFGYRFNRS
ncbi:hypothetical protein D3C81_1651770 [compost metagenome]